MTGETGIKMNKFKRSILPMMRLNHTSVFLLVSCIVSVMTYSRDSEGLTTFPTDIPSNVTTVSLSRNSILVLPDASFNAFWNIWRVTINYNGLVNISGTAFCNSSVVQIYLWDNELTRVPDLTCVGSRLTVLSVWNNKISHLENSDFEPLTKLETLHIGVNYIATADMSAFLPLGDSLTSLWIENTGINALNDVLQNFTSLEYLQMSQNTLVDISENAFNYTTSMKTLKCNKCHMIHLNWLPELCRVSAIRTIYLESNSIALESLLALENCVNLTYLNLMNNPLSGHENYTSIFASGWYGAQSIESLILQNTGIPASDIIFDNFNNLMVLDLSKNSLESVPNLTTVGDTLQELLLSDNKISSIPIFVFANNSILEILDLSNNELTTWASLSGLSMLETSLKILIIDGNTINGSIGEEIWELNHLEHLSVVGTDLTCIAQVCRCV